MSVGDKVIITTKTPGGSPQIALVNNVNADSIDVQILGGFERVANKDVHGTLVLVFPFVGTLLSAIGL